MFASSAGRACLARMTVGYERVFKSVRRHGAGKQGLGVRKQRRLNNSAGIPHH